VEQIKFIFFLAGIGNGIFIIGIPSNVSDVFFCFVAVIGIFRKEQYPCCQSGNKDNEKGC
jgi:hypothetical protein